MSIVSEILNSKPLENNDAKQHTMNLYDRTNTDDLFQLQAISGEAQINTSGKLILKANKISIQDDNGNELINDLNDRFTGIDLDINNAKDTLQNNIDDEKSRAENAEDTLRNSIASFDTRGFFKFKDLTITGTDKDSEGDSTLTTAFTSDNQPIDILNIKSDGSHNKVCSYSILPGGDDRVIGNDTNTFKSAYIDSINIVSGDDGTYKSVLQIINEQKERIDSILENVKDENLNQLQEIVDYFQDSDRNILGRLQTENDDLRRDLTLVATTLAELTQKFESVHPGDV